MAAWQEFFDSMGDGSSVSQELIFGVGKAFLAEQLAAYLIKEGKASGSFEHDIQQAAKLNDAETGYRFWSVLQHFEQQSWRVRQGLQVKGLRFVNTIEELQQYSGSQVLPTSTLKLKRKQRLALAYALTWEHLRYLAGAEDEQSPSAELFTRFGVSLDEHEHEHAH
ncbi:hypothetical protein Q4519_01165 [Motilimonas sp. 1_MG-2023]|uniref:hypothetical protein n=1 Tax=Motilimonas sp. 1_MG-2023 TaxID=3062672 RepID=UPI0026E3CBF1|nr:hypothetical protein [Motilimonas sp. 1_MG-2023]MDO6524279.1 hypothetical protein [Motilimonas sp. 1_MG-2023]